MANRNFNRRQALEKEVKDLYANVSIAGTGAPTLVSKIGISSIVRTSQGLYRLTLEDKYVSLKHLRIVLKAASAEDLIFQLKAEDVAGAVPYIDFFSLAGSSVTDPSSGSSLLIKIEVKNTDQV
jgi:hypothetical protein